MARDDLWLGETGLEEGGSSVPARTSSEASKTDTVQTHTAAAARKPLPRTKAFKGMNYRQDIYRN